MHRIDGTGATVDGMFTEGNPAEGVPATTVTAAWLNDQQESLCNIVEEAGETPQKGNFTQLYLAIKKLFGDFLQIGANAANTRPIAEKLQELKSPKDFGATGDGVANDQAAFDALEVVLKGRAINLDGKTYLVTTRPKRNTYYNGKFKVGGAILPASLFDTYRNMPPKAHYYGGQLAALHKALTNPLEQLTNITFIGDSITWGDTLPENAVSTPRNNTLADPRDVFLSPSFVNEFKRYIGATYFDNAVPVLSNWSYSASGESTATYKKTLLLYPNLTPFTITQSGGTTSVTDSATPAAKLGYRCRLGDGNAAGTSYIDVSFNFTGNKLAIWFTSINTSSANYELIVDGVNLGEFETWTGVTANAQRREHTFNYVRNKTVTIRTKRRTDYASTRYLDFEALEVEKTCTIVNQGIIGTTSHHYKANMFGAYGPSVLTSDVNHVIVQLGTNDRISSWPTYNKPNGQNNFERNLKELLDLLTPTTSVTLMCANPATLDAPPTYTFGMQVVRDVVNSVGKERSLDVIDNYTIFRGAHLDDVTADGLHPNDLGHLLIARNIVGALEAAR